MRNKRGPKIEPCGTPETACELADFVPPPQHYASYWLDSYVARSWYRGPGPGPWVLTWETDEVLNQMPFQSQKILHQSHSLLQVVATSHGLCWSMQTKQTCLVGSPTDNWIMGVAQQDGQIWACENVFLGLYSELTIGIWAGNLRETLPQATLEWVYTT